MPTQDERPSLQKRSLEDVAATQADHTRFLVRIVDRLDEMFDEINKHTELLEQILDRLPPAKE
jgi:ABC-type transporter Mla subunit MlaD